MQPSNQAQLRMKVEARVRTMRIVWFALLISVGLYYALTIFTGRNESVEPNKTLSLALLGAGLMMAAIALLIKQRFLTQSVEQQRADLVQQGYIVAWAMTEVAALFGLLDFFLTANRYYIILFIVAAGGMLLNFPRPQHVLAACFKSSTF